MALTSQLLYESALLRVRCVCCRPHDTACGAMEAAHANTLAFLLRGVFVKHHANGRDVVAHTGEALFFNADEPYRVSHPAGGGDDCLVLEPGEAALRELLANFDAAAADAESNRFGATHATLPPAALLQRRLLWQRLRDGRATALEIEELALELFGIALGEAKRQTLRSADPHPRARQRRREQVRATAVVLASRPEDAWTLERLARRVHGSPFHLARSFRAELGTSIHRYLLRARLARALDEVLDSEAELTVIGASLGFSTPSHFTAAFRKAYAVTPSQLRRHVSPATARELRRISTADGWRDR